MSDETIRTAAVTGLLREILSGLDDRGVIRPARVAHVVAALQQLLRGPRIAEGDVGSVTAVLAAHIADMADMAAPATYDDQNGPYATREQAEAAYAYFTRSAESGTLGTRARFPADAIIDALDEFASTGAYDRDLAERLASLLTEVDIGVVCSWVRRAAHDRPEAGQ
jgi:hypothetical protein